MSQDYKSEPTDLRATRSNLQEGRDGDEDPLVELARLVQQNRQSANARVDNGRVENTDYFAELNDVAEKRVEPAIGETTNQTHAGTTQLEQSFVEQDGSAHVSSLWPEDPTLSGSENVADARQPELPISESSLSQDISAELAQNLSSELEEELVGNLHASLNRFETPSVPEVTPSDASAFQANSQEQEPENRHPLYGINSQASEHPSDMNPSQLVASKVDPAEPQDSRNAGPGKPHSEPSQDISQLGEIRPKIDENDLFAAINPPSDLQAASGHNQTEDPAGIDVLFADLDFPPPSSQERREHQLDERFPAGEPSASETPAEPQAPNVDEMTWPEAASQIPQLDEPDGPPPPEGYDLDAVARAMQESDPSLAATGVLPPHSPKEKKYAPRARQKSRRGILAAASISGVAICGGLIFLLFGGEGGMVPDGPPPIIAGLQGPLKVYPEDGATASPENASTKVILDRVNGQDVQAPATLRRPENPRPVDLPPAPESLSAGAELAPGTPRQVRTIQVRPDGTFVSDSRPVSTSPSTPSIEVSTVPVRVNNNGERSIGETAGQPAVPTQAQPQVTVAATQPTATPSPEAGQVSQLTVPVETPNPQNQLEPTTSSASQTVVTIIPRRKPAAPVQVARAPQVTTPTRPVSQPSGPLNLTRPNSVAPSVAQPANTGAIPSGTYIVQVTSQRSAQAASETYAGLQRRYPSILGSQNAVIVSANVPDRGVFYRARIPAQSRGEALSLCERLQSAGGECFVRRQP